MASHLPRVSVDNPRPMTSASTATSTSDSGPECPFCRIARLYEAYDPRHPPRADSKCIAPSLTSPNPDTYILLSTLHLVAFLDIMPLSRGHLLLCPRRHTPKLTGTTSSEAQELGNYLRILSAALCKATGVDDWNVVQNNGAAAAQVVPHLHFHIIPRPEIRAQGRWSDKFTMFGRGQRTDLDPEDGEKLVESIRREVARLSREEENQTHTDTVDAKL